MRALGTLMNPHELAITSMHNWWRRRESAILASLCACKRKAVRRHAACGMNSLLTPRPAVSFFAKV